MTKKSQSQHYVPQFLLRNWASVDGRMEVLRRTVRGVVTSRLAPRSTAFEDDLYSFRDMPLSSNTDPDHIEERVLQRVDNEASLVARRLNEGGLHTLSSEERRSWATFIRSLFERHPDRLSENEEQARAIGDKVLENMLRSSTSRDGFRRLKVALDSSVDLDAGTANLVRRTMVAELQRSDGRDPLVDMWWQVLKLPPGQKLLTSDKPLVVNCNAAGPPVRFFQVALSPETIFVALPRSWRLLAPALGDARRRDLAQAA